MSTAKARYEQLILRREPFLRRARACAKLTIGTLLPPEGHNSSAIFQENYQSLGARMTVSLSSRILMAMYPPGLASFRFGIPAETVMKLENAQIPAELEKNLAKAETLVTSEIESAAWRQPTHLALQYLVVTGNVLEQMLEDNTIRLYRLDQYVVVRDPSGRLKEIVIQEWLSRHGLDDDLAKLASGTETNDNVALYTHIKCLKDGSYTVRQEMADQLVPDSEGTYAAGNLPFKAHRWTAVIGEDYGRGKIEEHYADLSALDGLSKAFLDGAALASRHITLVKPNASGGLNLKNRIVKADNGDVIIGDIDDVDMLQYENGVGLQFTQAGVEALKRELQQAFLMNASASRDAERVTAYEVRMLIEELENTLGGVYSILSVEMQAWRLERLTVQMQAQQKLPMWDKTSVKPVVLTGLEALGREQEVQRVGAALQFLQTVPKEIVQQHVKFADLLTVAFVGLRLPNAIRSEEEAYEYAQKMSQIQTEQNVATAAGQAVSQAAAQGMTPQ